LFLIYKNTYIQKKILSLKIECDYNKCKGACCKGEGLGTPLNLKDIERISEATSKDSFYHYFRGPRLVCEKNGDCSFLNGDLCSINDIKPDFCILFPLQIERKNGLEYILFNPYEKCKFKDSDKFLIEHVSKALNRLYGNDFVPGLIKLAGSLENV